jgi:hypothetical protein
MEPPSSGRLNLPDCVTSALAAARRVGRRAGIWEHTPVAKSNKQRRQGRAKRANTAQQRARRRQESRKQARAGRITQALYDPEAPVEAVAAAIVDMFAPGPTVGLAGSAGRAATGRGSRGDR